MWKLFHKVTSVKTQIEGSWSGPGSFRGTTLGMPCQALEELMEQALRQVGLRTCFELGIVLSMLQSVLGHGQQVG